MTNPRTAIGLLSPLHYIFLVSDGRTKESKGLSLLELAELMQDLGCVTAYNLDGGGSSTFWFNGRVLNRPTTYGKQIEERSISDIVYIGQDHRDERNASLGSPVYHFAGVSSSSSFISSTTFSLTACILRL